MRSRRDAAVRNLHALRAAASNAVRAVGPRGEP